MIQHLEECRAKIKRAKQHFNALTRRIEHSRANQGHGIRIKFNRKTQRVDIRVYFPPQLNIRWSIISGEIVQHCRSALDYAVWQAVLLNGNEPLEGVTCFPVFNDPVDYEKGPKRGRGRGTSGKTQIKGVKATVAKVIKEAQPFGPQFQLDPLWMLHGLWIRDKHRRLNLGIIGSGSTSLGISGGVGTVFHPLSHHGTLWASFPVASVNMNVYTQTPSAVVLDESGPGQGEPLLETLARFIDHSERIIYAIEVAL